jgi:alpha-D-xyloside xylohydrolase
MNRVRYSIIPINYNEASKTLTIGKREGSFDGMLKNRKFNVVWISTTHPVSVDNKSAGRSFASYHGERVTVKMK